MNDNSPTARTEDQRLAEQLASLMTRYAALKDLNEEGLLMAIEGMLEGMGFECLEGVWQKKQ